MSFQLRTRTTVPETGVITLPDIFLGKTVDIIVREADTKVRPLKTKVEDTSVYSLKGLLKGRTEEELDEAKYQYLKEKYIHDDDID